MDNLANEIQQKIAQLPDQKTETVRTLRKAYTREFKDKPREFVLERAYELVAIDEWMYQMIAHELVHHHSATLNGLILVELEKLGVNLTSWDRVDLYATHLSGVAWRIGNISDEVVFSWTQSDDRWWRRTALVSTVALNNRARGGTGDIERTFLICEQLIDDRDDMVVKALSWALRAASFWSQQAVWDFIKKHNQRLAPRVNREVKTKLITGLKNPKRVD